MLRKLNRVLNVCALLFVLMEMTPVSAASTDWLVNAEAFKASVVEDHAARELVLSNGLARRALRLSPNAASVSLENLTSGEQFLRAIGPEAHVTINGVEFVIGGLEGQPVMNYLKAEWLDQLRDNPNAYHFSEWKEGGIEARLAWKKRPEWLSRDLPWPPLGKHVMLRFVPPSAPLVRLAGPVVFEDAFQGALDTAWKVHVSDKHARSSFSNEGKAGEIFTLPDTAVYVERPFPKDAVSIEVKVDAGDDTTSNSWGPGLALLAEDRTISFVIRPNSRQYEVVAPDRGELLAGTFDRSKPSRLRLRIENGTAICEAEQEDNAFERVATVAFPKAPTTLRIGKVGKAGKGNDYPDAKGDNLVRCHVTHVTLRGPEPTNAPPPPSRIDLPEIEVHHEIYDGIPLLSKWLVIKNKTQNPVRVNAFTAEELRLVEVESGVNAATQTEKSNLCVETDYAFDGMSAASASPAVVLTSDPHYPTQVNYERQTPCLLLCKPPLGPDREIAPGGTFETFRVFELLLDSTERERRTLAQRRMYRTIAPWTAENPLMFHKIKSDPRSIRDAIEQAHEVGFEMIIMSFGSGFNIENRDPKYLEQYKELAAEAKSNGVALGGYSLLASRGAGTAKDNTQGVPARFGVMPCLGAKWGQDYLAQVRQFLGAANLGVLEHDGSYPGDRCAAHDHPGHRGVDDSQWVQWRAITDLYKWCRSEGIFLNVPDWYVLSGSSKTGMGYRETNWSLPRAEQEIIERQNIYDGTWNKTASMGWMFVPLSQYHGGGAAATIEPLHDHLDHYNARFANLIGAGVQACYRGPRLYDTEETKALVKKWVTFYKTHREALDGDLIHLRRANGRDWDGWLHVNPRGKEKGLAFIYNPLSEAIERDIRMPLHYTGLTNSAKVSVEGADATVATLDSTDAVTLKVKVPGHGYTWFVFE
jgi:hypothetical protein